eukprot:gnl/Spiro4/13088_TR6939_c0_g2_i1.p1 gnl/Spiro4/13088_TR6939_c0_g2~~gnl/Spiro4/13088_TR6939_c0_g2_i1.p1  ORF type:complete len:509 (-),score=82.32 gnl/Spiro4/13088_TR6939_c0_g2_i1:85-1557(-)
MEIRKSLGGVVHVAAIEGRDLIVADINGFSDPYLIFTIDEGQKFKTEIIYKNLNPVWNESLRTRCLPVHSLESNLNIEVWDHDTIGSDDYMGQLSIPLRSLIDQQVHTQWFAVQGRPNKPKKRNNKPRKFRGDLRLKLQFSFPLEGVPNVVLPESILTLQPILEGFGRLLGDHDLMAIKAFISAGGVCNESSVIRVLYNLCGPNSVCDLVSYLLLSDIDNLSDVNQLFRRDSPGTKFFHSLFFVLGHGWLHDCLYIPILGICAANPHLYDTDTRAGGICNTTNMGSQLRDENLSRLFGLARLLMLSVFDSVDVLPPVIRKVVANLLAHVHSKFGEEIGVRAVASLYMLRLICPLVTIPENLRLCDEPNPEQRRLLRRVSQILLNFANGAAGQSEDAFFVERFNVFMEKYRSHFLAFCGQLAQPFATPLVATTPLDLPPCTSSKDLCHLHTQLSQKQVQIEDVLKQNGDVGQNIFSSLRAFLSHPCNAPTF